MLPNKASPWTQPSKLDRLAGRLAYVPCVQRDHRFLVPTLPKTLVSTSTCTLCLSKRHLELETVAVQVSKYCEAVGGKAIKRQSSTDVSVCCIQTLVSPKWTFLSPNGPWHLDHLATLAACIKGYFFFSHRLVQLDFFDMSLVTQWPSPSLDDTSSILNIWPSRSLELRDSTDDRLRCGVGVSVCVCVLGVTSAVIEL